MIKAWTFASEVGAWKKGCNNWRVALETLLKRAGIALVFNESSMGIILSMRNNVLTNNCSTSLVYEHTFIMSSTFFQGMEGGMILL